MPTTFTLGMLALVVIGSFVISGYSYARQQALQKRKQAVKKLQQTADEALNYQTLLLKIDPSYELLIKLQTLAIDALKKALAITPNDKLLAHNLKVQQNRLKDFNENRRENPITCWSVSDAELAQGQTQLGQLDKLLDLFRNRGELSINQHQHFHQHLKKLQLDYTANSYLYQADHFAEQGNLASYQLYMKQAIQIIKKSDLQDEEKNKQIKALTDRINEVKNTGKMNQLSNLVKPEASDNE